MARTGYKITVYLDDNPNSPTYGETYTARTLDSGACPVSEDDLVMVGNQCEIDISGLTGYRIITYYNTTTGEYTEVREEDPECEPSTSEEQWVNSGSPYCETTEQGLNTGYMLQLQVQVNQNLSNYGATRYSRYKSPECGGNGCASWNDIQTQCHIAVNDCVATFDGTEDVTQIDVNPLSETYNQTRTINRESTGNCQNCTETTFSWVDVGEMCGDDDMLCGEGLQQTPTTKYMVRQKYKTIGSGTPEPMGEYQITVVEEESEDCGYIAPQYKWEVAVGQYLCDYETYTKYQMEVRWVSYDSGLTWSVDAETEPRRGDVIAYDSYDCGKPMYKWEPTDNYVCVDNGDDWKLKIVRSSGDPYIIPCDYNPVLTNSDVAGIQRYTDATLVDFGDCVNTINCNIPTQIGGSNPRVEIQFGDYVEEIGDGNRLINGWTLIKNNTFKDRVRRINHYAFSGVTSYENKALYLPSSIEYLGQYSFYQSANDGYGLNTVIVGSTTPPEFDINSSGGYVFGGGVEAIFVPRGTVSTYRNHAGWSYYGGKIFSLAEEDVFFRPVFSGISGYAISSEGMDYLLTSQIIHISYSGLGYSSMTMAYIGNSVTSIGLGAFSGCKMLESVSIPDSVTSISGAAFSNCISLTSITIPSGVTSISNNVFYKCSGLTNVTIPDGVTSIGNYAFEYCFGLTSVTIGSGLTSIGSYAFDGCSGLTSLVIPDNVTNISDKAFKDCTSLSSLTISSGVTNVGDYAFSGCTSLRILNVDTNAALSGTFRQSNITDLVIGDNVTEIGASAFTKCNNLSSVTIGSNVETIGNRAFSSGRSLTSIVIPDSVTSIGDIAFYYCTSLTSITIQATTPPTLDSNVFGYTNDCPIYVPAESVETYKAASGWSRYTNRIQAIPNQ